MSNRTLASTQKQGSAWTAPVRGGILQRKCACGNQTTGGGTCRECKNARSTLQRQLTIGASNDPLEREADRVADQVVGRSAHISVGQTLSRVQREARPSADGGDTAPPSVDGALAGPGTSLQPELRERMEQRFCYDFSRVRVHTDATAAQSAQEVDANAYTVGNDIVFGAGKFAPTLPSGERLIAHELAHVVQQASADPLHVGQADARDGSVHTPLLFGGGAAATLQRDDRAPSASPAQLPVKVIPGNTPLSRRVQAYRVNNPNLPEGTNLVGVEYSTPGGGPQTEIFENRPGVAHSEEVMDQFFRDLRRRTSQEPQVLKIYSERQFCGPSEHDCEGLLLRTPRYRSAEKTFGYDYQDASRRVPGGGPYRAGQSRGRVEESHERLTETRNLEWDFQKKPTQPYHERLGQPKPASPNEPSTTTAVNPKSPAGGALKGLAIHGGIAAGTVLLAVLDGYIKAHLDSKEIQKGIIAKWSEIQQQIEGFSPQITALMENPNSEKVFAAIKVTILRGRSFTPISPEGSESVAQVEGVQVNGVSTTETTLEETTVMQSDALQGAFNRRSEMMFSLPLWSRAEARAAALEQEQARERERRAQEQRDIAKKLQGAANAASKPSNQPSADAQPLLAPPGIAARPPVNLLPGAPAASQKMEPMAVAAVLRSEMNGLLQTGEKLVSSTGTTRAAIETFGKAEEVWRLRSTYAWNHFIDNGPDMARAAMDEMLHADRQGGRLATIRHNLGLS
jgi:hypothetical protein